MDEHGTELDVLLWKRRDIEAAQRFFTRLLVAHPVPRTIVTDKLFSYTIAKPWLASSMSSKRLPA